VETEEAGERGERGGIVGRIGAMHLLGHQRRPGRMGTAAGRCL